MRRALAAIGAGLFLLGCGAIRPGLVIQRGGFIADAYGFGCECGNRAFVVLERTFERVHLRCLDCQRDWWATLAP